MEADAVEFANVEADSDASAKAEASEGEAGLAKVEGEAEPAQVEANGENGDASEPTAKAEAGAAADRATEESDTPVPYTLPGIGEETDHKLVNGGFATLEALGAATLEQLSEIPGIGGKTAEKVLAAVRGDAPAADDSSADL